MSFIRILSRLCAILGVFASIERGVVFAANAHDGFPIASAFSPTDTGYDGFIYSAAQDSNGVIYFGGDVLLAFDGERWTQTSTAGLQVIRSINFGVDGKIWTAALGEIGYFSRDAGDKLQYTSLKQYASMGEIPNGEIFRAFPTTNGAVFVATDRILHWNGASLQRFDMPGVRTLPTFRINSDIYIDYRLKGLYILDQNKPRLIIPQEKIGPIGTPIAWLDQINHNTWLMVTTLGLELYNGEKTSPFAPEVSKLIRDGIPNCGVRLPNGDYAFGTIKAGIILMHPNGAFAGKLTAKRDVPVNFITSLFVDKQGELWATSPTHILRFNLQDRSTIFDDRSSLPPQAYYAVARMGDEIVLGSTSGIYTSSGQRSFTRLPFLAEIMHDVIAMDDGIYALGFRGVWKIQPTGKLLIHETPQDVFAMSKSRTQPGRFLYAETSRIVCQAAESQEEVIFDNLPQLPTSIAETPDGLLWVGTISQGALCIARGSNNHPAKQVPIKYEDKSAIGNTIIRAAADGTIFIFADNGAWIKRVESEALTPIHGYPSRSILAAAQPTDDSVWVAVSGSDHMSPAVGQVHFNDHTAYWEFTDIAGLGEIGTPRGLLLDSAGSNENVLWIAGTDGVIRYDASAKQIPAVTPNPPLLRVYATTNRGERPTPVIGRLPYATSAIDFQFSEPDFIRRPLLRLETKIDGIDSTWIAAGKDATRALTAIRDGHYTFEVRAVANTGLASQPTVFKFEVAPPWWRTNPAIAAEVAALGLLIFGGYRWRMQTLRKRNAELEAKVKERTEELAEASAAKTMFVANMSHDIRNPLNGIVGLALALEQTKLDGKQREIIATLRECTTYLSSLVDDVLDFASIEAGRVELRMGPFVPADLLNSIVTALKAQAAEKGALITIETDPDLPPMLRGDAGRIQQILVNYLANALKYAGGHVRVIAALAPNSRDEIELSVADEGAGISAEEQKTLFTKFSRLDSARRAEIKGSGLGLASCRALADIMGGSVGVESKVGHGSRFFLRLPLEVAVEIAPQSASDIALPSTSVLLVEDTEYNAMAATAVLAKLGLTCDRAKNGEEAVRLFAEKRHSVVLLDRNLPDMDGTEVAGKMRELEVDGNHSLLLAVTAYCTAEDRQLCLKAGMDAFVGKPLTPEKLRKVLLDAARQMLGTASIEAAPDATVTRAASLSTAAAEPALELDTTLLEFLSDGTPAGVAAQAERFLAELAQVHGQLLAAREAAPNIFGDAAHRVLGQARMIGAAALCEAAAQLETAARKSDAATIAVAFPLVSAEVAKLTEALRRRPGVQKV